MIKLKRGVIVKRLYSFLLASELMNTVFDHDHDIAIRAGYVGVPHEDQVDLVRIYFLRIWVIEHSWVVWSALLRVSGNYYEEQEKETTDEWAFHHDVIYSLIIMGDLQLLS